MEILKCGDLEIRREISKFPDFQISKWYNREMSRLNGDKSRHQINRKRVVLRREKIRKLVEEAKAKGATSNPSTAKAAQK